MITPSLRFKNYSNEWSSAPLENITNYVDYRGRTPGKCDGGIFLVTAKNIRQGYIDYDTSKEYIASSEYDAVMRRGIPEIGDVLITTEAPLGYVASVDRTNIALAQRVIKFRGKAGVLLNGYLKYLMSSAAFQKELNEKATGGTAKGIKGSVLHKMICSYPKDQQEQTKIATFLSAIDEKINHLTQKHELLEQYKKGVMQKIFSQEIRFKNDQGEDFPEWEENILSNICLIKKGKQLNRSELSDSYSYPVINGGQEPSGFTDIWNSKENSITISEGGNSCGFVNLIKSKFWSGGHCYTLNNIKYEFDDVFIYQFLKFNESAVMRLRVGSGLPNIQKSAISDFLISNPKDKSEQMKISSFLSAIDEKISNIKSQLEATKQYKQGLLQQMFV